MDSANFVEYFLVDKRKEAPTTNRYVFTPKDEAARLKPIPVASCVMLTLPSLDIVRPYTPIGLVDDRHVEFCIKTYPSGGLTPHLDALKEGDSVMIKWPIQKFKYVPGMWKHVGMLSGGTGVTPMYQVIKQISENAEDKTKVTLVAAFRNEEEILMREDLDKFGKDPRITIHYILSDAKDQPKHGMLTGQIDSNIIQKYMPKEGHVLVCGTPAMMDSLSGQKAPDKSQGTLKGWLKDLDYNEQNVFKY